MSTTTRPTVDHVINGTRIQFWAANQPNATAIVDGERTITFDEFNRKANQLVRALRERGLGIDSSVAVMAGNSIEWALVAFATERSGMRLVPVNWHLAESEVAYILDDAKAEAIFVDARSSSVGRAAAEATSTKFVIEMGPADGDEHHGLDEILEGYDDANIPDPTIGSKMLYTSGTTGFPKGVWRSRENWTSRQVAAFERDEARQPPLYEAGTHVHLSTGPWYHGGPGLTSLQVPLLSGIPVVILEPWDSERFLQLVEEHRVTHTHLVPILFHRLLQLPDELRSSYDVTSLRYVRHGAAPCPIHVKRKMIEWLGPVVEEYYSATEATATIVTSEEWLKKPGTVGRSGSVNKVLIVDEDGNEVPRGEQGVVYIYAGGTGEFEYLGDSEKTRHAHLGEFFTAGDIGYLDEDDYLFLTDRSANLIISGGVNIYPAEIEACLSEHPAVRDVGVVGVPDEEWGEAVWAGIELTPEHAQRDPEDVIAELRDHVRSRLARYKCPQVFRIEEDLPREMSGKLIKRTLREQYRALAVAATDALADA